MFSDSRFQAARNHTSLRTQGTKFVSPAKTSLRATSLTCQKSLSQRVRFSTSASKSRHRTESSPSTSARGSTLSRGGRSSLPIASEDGLKTIRDKPEARSKDPSNSIVFGDGLRTGLGHPRNKPRNALPPVRVPDLIKTFHRPPARLISLNRANPHQRRSRRTLRPIRVSHPADGVELPPIRQTLRKEDRISQILSCAYP